ncbi:hypothetical protein PAMP_023240 [Pampus punctatissimus]
MNSLRSLSFLTICLCIQLSLCVLGSTSASTSLWGKKLQFRARPCVWQLHPDVAVPALKELSVCVGLRRSHATTWTGFVYKAPGGRNIELGLGGTGAKLSVWLFGEDFHIERELKLHEWYSVCLTWSGQAQRLRIYVNGDSQHEASVNPIKPQQLAPNGTLTLGVSHYIDANGNVQEESGKTLLGEIGLFRMWAREWSAEELRRQSCADGDVLSWDLRYWKYNCPPEPDNSLHCDSFPLMTKPPPTVSTGVTSPEIGPTQSLPTGPTNMSTTGEPLDLNETAVGPDTFFRVNVTLSMTGIPTKPKDIVEKWLSHGQQKQ